MLDKSFPVPPQPEFFRRFFVRQQRSMTWALYEMQFHWMLASVVYLAWPWLTYLALLLFQMSMRRARVRPVHVLRCVIYTFDVTALISWVLLAFAAALVVAAPLLLLSSAFEMLLLATALIMIGVFTYRLAVAYRLYLQFPHAVPTVVTSQVITLVAVVTLVFVVSNLVWPVRS